MKCHFFGSIVNSVEIVPPMCYDLLTKNKQGIFDMGKTGEDYKNEVVTYAKNP